MNWSVNELIKIANQFDSVLDIGCGTGQVLKRIKAKTRYGIDACHTVIDRARQNAKGANFYCMNLIYFQKYTWHQPIQLIYGLDIIEHLEEDDAFRLLLYLEEIASDMIILFIPVGNHPQTRDDRGFGNDYFQTHRSIWYPSDMEKLGYKVWYYPDWHKNIKPPKEKGAMWCQKIFKEV